MDSDGQLELHEVEARLVRVARDVGSQRYAQVAGAAADETSAQGGHLALQ